jgi:8-oxo-dGTP pyrophosphatase MutT (NUDIX family)
MPASPPASAIDPVIAQDNIAEGKSLLRQLRRYPAVNYGNYLRFIVAGQHVGWVRRDVAPHLARFADIFLQDDARIVLQPDLTDADARSVAMAKVLENLRTDGLVPGWRNEIYPVGRGFDQPVLLRMERAATPLFGVLSYGVNVNGLVQRADGLHVWIGRRSPHKQVDPNMLDLLAGGGQPLGISIEDNLIKECHEEAGVPAAMASQAKPVSVITLQIEATEGLRVGLQFNYDLYLPVDFQPRNTDGEVAEFKLMPVVELLDRLQTGDEFMYDIALAKIDLLIRHGFIGPDEPHYLDLLAGIRRPIMFDPL